MRYTKFIALLDPDPKKMGRITDYDIGLFVENADVIYVGGTPNTDLDQDEKRFTEETISRVVKERNRFCEKTNLINHPPIYIFPGSPGQVVPGADYLLYLFLPNSNSAFFGWQIQRLSMGDVEKIYPMDRLIPMMYLPKGGSVGKYADIDEEWRKRDYEDITKIANMLGFKAEYLEGGSGAERIDIEIVKSVSGILHPDKELMVGGGFTELDYVDEVIGVVDNVIVGTKLEINPGFAVEVRELLDERQKLKKA